MNNIKESLSQNLKRLRNQSNLSIDELSTISRVDAHTLSQLEEGVTDASISSLLKVADALNTTPENLLSVESDFVIHAQRKNIEPKVENNGKLRIYPIFPYDHIKKFEEFTVELDSGCVHNSPAHSHGVEEYIVVTTGTLDVTVEGAEYKLAEGDGLRYSADKPHSYINNTDSTVVIQYVAYYAD